MNSVMTWLVVGILAAAPTTRDSAAPRPLSELGQRSNGRAQIAQGDEPRLPVPPLPNPALTNPETLPVAPQPAATPTILPTTPHPTTIHAEPLPAAPVHPAPFASPVESIPSLHPGCYGAVGLPEVPGLPPCPAECLSCPSCPSGRCPGGNGCLRHSCLCKLGSTCDLYPHYAYYPRYHGYYYFRPYNYMMIGPQQEFAAQIGLDPRMPYSLSNFDAIYASWAMKYPPGMAPISTSLPEGEHLPILEELLDRKPTR